MQRHRRQETDINLTSRDKKYFQWKVQWMILTTDQTLQNINEVEGKVRKTIQNETEPGWRGSAVEQNL